MARQADESDRAPARAGFQGNRATEPLSEFPADRQSQAVALDTRVLVAWKAIKRLKNLVQRIGGNARPVIDHGQAPMVFFDGPLDRDPASARVYFSALQIRLPKTCWQSEASVITEAAGSEAIVSQARPASDAAVGELTVNLPDDAPSEKVQREGLRPLSTRPA